MPLVVAQLIGYFNDAIDLYTALVYGCVLTLCIFIAGVIHHPTFNNGILYGMRLRISCAGLVYREVNFFNIIKP